MRFIKLLIIPVIVAIGIYIGFKSDDKDSLPTKEKKKVAKIKKIAKKPTLPSTMFISELTSMRETKSGKPSYPLIIGTKVNILKEDNQWVEISNHNHKGWVEKNILSNAQLKDKEIYITKKVLTKVKLKPKVNSDSNADNKKPKPNKKKYIMKMVDTKYDIKKLYHLGNVQFRSINKKNYPNNPRISSKGIYISINGMYHVEEYIKLAKKSNINTFVLDLKNDTGRTLFDSPTVKNALGKKYFRPRITDIHAFMKKLKDNHIYLIGRISTFKDEAYAETHKRDVIIDKRHNRAYKSSDKISWLTAYDRNNWYYNIGLAKEAADLGFNEILFDYVRFPDRVQSLEKHNYLSYNNKYHETKSEAIQRFLKYAHDELSKKQVYITASIFGQVGISTADENIGQDWEAVSTIVDNVNPMAYPSHFAAGTFGLRVPDANPYKLMNQYAKRIIARDKALDDPARVNIWIQGFTAPWIKGHLRYKGKELKEQIRGIKDTGLNQYLVWNASSRYSWDGLK